MNNLKLITTHKDYLLLVDTESNIPNRSYFLLGELTSEVRINQYRGNADGGRYNTHLSNLIIAHLPLNNVPVLEGVPLLPELPKQEDVEKRAIDFANKEHPFRSTEFVDGIIEGYKANTKSWSDANMIDMFVAGFHHTSSGEKLLDDEAKDYLQSLSPVKLPVGFEPEYEYSIDGIKWEDEGIGSIRRFKIINNVIQGEWIYE